jgi:hypothetical protein
VYISKIKKIAQDTDSAATNMLLTTVALKGAHKETHQAARRQKHRRTQSSS